LGEIRGFGRIITIWRDPTAATPALRRWKMSILLNPDLEHRIAVKVKSGRYRSPAEVIQEGLNLLEARDAATQSSAAPSSIPLWEAIAGIGQKLSAEEWAPVPADLARNVDHHLYGSPKV
jgi:putative addiction module CopG family antidote